ncbi:hypothetical protein HY948_04855 [Candidatus Gottesmanbacteria bacterium]|nr:hypothetical protein [Candidatus Gottesmanbacteria bacterium]
MKKLLLIAIVTLAAFLRLWNLGNVPPSASMDEASIGYNAYSVSKIGVDEYGVFPLISQRAYDDWRRSTYLLLVVPFVTIFNLQVTAVRLPAVILSIITVWATYQIVYHLFSKQTANAQNVGLLVSFLLTISPWHIYISRLGHESNAYLSFLVLGVMFFLKDRLLTALLFFALSIISYYAGQIFVPLFGLGLLAIYRASYKKFVVPLLVFTPFLIFIFWSIFSPSALVRFQGTSAFDLTQKKITNGKIFVENYVSHFKIKWLFTNSGRESFKVPNMGFLYVWELPFILIGIIAFLFHRDINTRGKQLVFLWFVLGPLPASVATQTPHAMRSYAFLPTWQIFTAFGLLSVYAALRRINTLSLVVFIFLIAVSLQSFYRNYYVVFPKEQSRSFLYALSKAIPYAVAREDQYGKIVFSNADQTYQSYMMYLYYTRFDPGMYQRLGGTKSGGYAETHSIGKYDFRPIIWKQEKPASRTLYIGNVKDFPDNAVTAARFYLLDGTPALSAVSVEP